MTNPRIEQAQRLMCEAARTGDLKKYYAMARLKKYYEEKANDRTR